MNARLIAGRSQSSELPHLSAALNQLTINKVFSLIDLLTSSSWKRSGWYRPIRQITDRDSPEPEEGDNRAVVRGRIEEANGEEDIESQPYQDDEPSNRNAWDGPRVEPSLLSDIH